jgi:two-component sensor histidine kinase
MLSYRDKPENLRYQTRLEGYDEEWAEWTKQTSLRYTNLRAALWPKTYFMQVRARDYLGNLYTTEAGAYPVTVTPPLYLRWWAILLYLALLGLAIRAYTRFRLRQQERDIRLREAATIRQQRDEITAKNEENETLLKEIHHRVKNNLEVVSSLLELQSETLEDGGALDAMRAGQSRVASMGLLHQKLYQGRDLASVNMLDYISELTESITQTYDVGEEVDIRIDVPSHLDLDVGRAVPVGLIVNELITNSLKYAFSSDTPSEGASAASGKRVQIHMNEREGQRIFLSVTDNGIGKSAGETLASGFGTRLVQLLTRQLEGELRESSRAGLRTEIIF